MSNVVAKKMAGGVSAVESNAVVYNIFCGLSSRGRDSRTFRLTGDIPERAVCQVLKAGSGEETKLLPSVPPRFSVGDAVSAADISPKQAEKSNTGTVRLHFFWGKIYATEWR